MNILVITQPAWNNQNNTGNTLSNFFEGTGFKFANLYFGGDQPDNTLCNQYYQISDFDILSHWLKHRPLGRSFTLNSNSAQQSKNTRDHELKAKAYSNFYTQLLRELMWKCTKVVNSNVIDWIKTFNPNIIYAPTFGNFHMLRIVRQIADYFKEVPVISDISDDHYFRFKDEKNLIKYFFNTFLLRRSLLKTFTKYSLLYTMTEIQQQLYQPLIQAPIKIMRKKALYSNKQSINHQPLKMIYAGGLYLGRENTLIRLIEALAKLNSSNVTIQFDIFTSTRISSALNKLIHMHPNILIHNSISYTKLQEIYKTYDIALLLESFDSEYSLQTRLSFSTKIVDALQSGCAIFAIGPSSNAGFQYLNKNNAAIFVDSIENIDLRLTECIRHLTQLKQRTYYLCKTNHDKAFITKQIIEDFNWVQISYQQR